MASRTVHVGILQYAPVHGNLAASMERLETLLAQAAQAGVELVVVGESWLSGYPAWLDLSPNVARWDHTPTKQAYAAMYRNSITASGPEVQQIQAWVKQHSMVLGLGINERIPNGPANGSLFNSILLFDADGRLANHHRKLVPTYTERLVHAQGDAHGLQAVDTAAGRISALVCWEHWMPMARHALHTSGQDIHLALWPTVHEMHQVASRQYAFEGRCYVLAAGQLMQARDLPAQLDQPAELAPDDYVMRGGSAIIGPDGYYLTQPLYEASALVTAELNLDRLAEERMTLDTTGHYARPDIFNVHINRQRYTQED